MSSLEIISVANEELAAAASGYRLSRRLQILTFILSVTSIFISNTYTYIPALVALIVQLTAWAVRLRAGRNHAIGDEGRRRGLLLNAFGPTSERIDLTNWLNRISPDTQDRARKSVDPDYFASSAQTGVRRLCEHLQENALWGKCLYSAAATYYMRFLFAFAGSAVLSALVAIPLASGDGKLILARVLVAVLAFGAAITQINEIMSWRAAEGQIEAIDRRLDVLVSYSDDRLKSDRIEALFAVYGDYSIATAAAPPVPRWIYLRERDRLNDLWRQRTSQTP
jgi:hypothetical protein